MLTIGVVSLKSLSSNNSDHNLPHEIKSAYLFLMGAGEEVLRQRRLLLKIISEGADFDSHDIFLKNLS